MPAVSVLPASTRPSGAGSTESSRPSAGLAILLALLGASRIPSTIDRSRQGPPGLGPSGPTASDGSLIGHPPCRTQRGDRGSPLPRECAREILAADRLDEVVVHPGLEAAFAILREGAGGVGDDQLVGCRASPSRSAFATS